MTTVTKVLNFRPPEKTSTAGEAVADRRLIRSVRLFENPPASPGSDRGDAPADIDGLVRELAEDGMEKEIRGLLAAVASDLQRLEDMSLGSSGPRTSMVPTSSVTSPVERPTTSPSEPVRGEKCDALSPDRTPDGMRREGGRGLMRVSPAPAALARDWNGPLTMLEEAPAFDGSGRGVDPAGHSGTSCANGVRPMASPRSGRLG